MVKLLLLNGDEIGDTLKYKLSPMNLRKMLQTPQGGHMIIISDTMGEVDHKWHEQEQKYNFESYTDHCTFRVNIYRGHPGVRRRTQCNEPGRLIRLPDPLPKLKGIAGK